MRGFIQRYLHHRTVRAQAALMSPEAVAGADEEIAILIANGYIERARFADGSPGFRVTAAGHAHLKAKGWT